MEGRSEEPYDRQLGQPQEQTANPYAYDASRVLDEVLREFGPRKVTIRFLTQYVLGEARISDEEFLQLKDAFLSDPRLSQVRTHYYQLSWEGESKSQDLEVTRYSSGRQIVRDSITHETKIIVPGSLDAMLSHWRITEDKKPTKKE